MKLTALDLDILKEVGTMGSAHAATALSSLLGKKVKIHVPETKLIEVSQIPSIFKNEEEVFTAIYLNIASEIQGGLLLLFRQPEALKLANLLTNKEERILQNIGISALKECGNICINTYLNVLSQLSGLRFVPTIPAYATDMIGALLDGIGAQLAFEVNEALLIETEFSINHQNVSGYFLFIPNPQAISLLLKNIELKRRAA